MLLSQGMVCYFRLSEVILSISLDEVASHYLSSDDVMQFQLCQVRQIIGETKGQVHGHSSPAGFNYRHVVKLSLLLIGEYELNMSTSPPPLGRTLPPRIIDCTCKSPSSTNTSSCFDSGPNSYFGPFNSSPVRRRCTIGSGTRNVCGRERVWRR